jgi:membrane protein YqaA with SNARE-associated domain
VFEAIRHWALGLGPLGLFVIAALDASFFSFPQVNDALILVLSAKHPRLMPAYAGLSTLGSVVGSFALYGMGRRGGKAFLRRRFKAAHVERAFRLYERWGTLAIIVPALLPPPTPFKLFVLLSGASGMHPASFLAAVTVGRAARYFGQGLLAVEYGDEAGRWLSTHGTEFVIAVLVVSLAVVLAWVMRRRTAPDEADVADEPYAMATPDDSK